MTKKKDKDTKHQEIFGSYRDIKKSTKDLEEAVKEKVSPMLEETMEKSLGVTIPKLESDITDRLLNPHLDIYIPFELNFKDAKKKFKAEFLKKELRVHLGNISHLAKSLGIDRRSIHRAIKDLEIDVEEVRKQGEPEDISQTYVDKAIRSTFEQYKGVIHPEKMKRMYDEVPALSRNIAKFIPHPDLTWKEAERVFEKQFLAHALEETSGIVAEAAKKIELRVETLHRKLKKLGMK